MNDYNSSSLEKIDEVKKELDNIDYAIGKYEDSCKSLKKEIDKMEKKYQDKYKYKLKKEEELKNLIDDIKKKQDELKNFKDNKIQEKEYYKYEIERMTKEMN